MASSAKSPKMAENEFVEKIAYRVKPDATSWLP